MLVVFVKPPQVSVPFSIRSCASVPGEPILTKNFWCNKQEDNGASAVYKAKITGYEKSPMDFSGWGGIKAFPDKACNYNIYLCCLFRLYVFHFIVAFSLLDNP